MEAFFLSITTLFAFLVVVTAICMLLRFGMPPRAASSYQGTHHLAQPRHHLFGGALTLGLLLLFGATLMLAIVTR